MGAAAELASFSLDPLSLALEKTPKQAHVSLAWKIDLTEGRRVFLRGAVRKPLASQRNRKGRSYLKKRRHSVKGETSARDFHLNAPLPRLSATL